MAEKGFGVKEVNLIGPSGTPTITSPNNLNLNAVNVAISTNVSIGGTLSVTGNVSIGGTLTYEDVTNIDSVGLVTAREGVFLPDNKQLKLGNTAGAPDLKIYHSSGINYIDASAGNFALRGTGNDNVIYYTSNGDVEIYDNGSKKLETSSSGVTVTGTVTSDGFIGNATKITLTSSTANSSLPVLFSTGVIGSSGADTLINSSKLTFNPSSGTLSATIFSGSGASLTNLPLSNTDVQVLYTVTANGSSAYRFAGNGIVSTEDNPDVYLIRGLKYRFVNNSGGSHPFQIRESSGGSAYSAGVTNNGASSGNIDFQVPYSAPSHLYYQCTAHGGMVGNLYIRGAGGNNTNVGVTTFSGNVTTTQFKVTTGANAFETSANVFKGASGQKGVYLRSALSSATTPSYSSVDDTNTGIFLPGSDVFAVTTGGTERLRVESGGGLKFTGQGTSIPVAGILHHTNNNLYVRGGTSGLILGNQDNTNTIGIFDGNFIRFETTDGSERLRIGPAGQLGISGANYGTSGQVLTSQGSSSVVQWASVFNGALDGMIFGGTETTYTSGGTTYKVHTFLSTGFLRVTAATTMDFLIVAGGGGSAAAELSYGATGGGGAGGMVEGSSISIPAGKHTLTVGTGGAASNAYNVAGSGGDSTFAYGGTTVTAKGGAGSPDYATTGQNGGSGSGGSEPNGAAGSSTQSSQNSGISGISQFGNAGGAASGYQSGAGGGGGAGGAGQARSAGGAGGAGRANSITGSSVTYAVGGNGGPPATYTNATAGTNGRGNGATGASSNHPNEGQGAAGGSGIIIVRYVLT